MVTEKPHDEINPLLAAKLKSILQKLKQSGRVHEIHEAKEGRRYCGRCEYGFIIENGRARRCSCLSSTGINDQQGYIDDLLKRYRSGMPKKLSNVSAHTFLVRPGHQHIKPALDKYIRDLREGKNYGFFIFGKTGVGKSYAAAYVVNTVRHLRMMPATMVNFSRILSALRATFGNSDEHNRLLAILYDTRLLAIDDLGMEQRVKENPEMSWAVEQFYKVIDFRRDEELPTIITTNRTVDELRDRLGDAIMTRIGALTLRLDMSAHTEA